MDLSLVTQVRRNHALEHATIHVLSRNHPGIHLVGRSDWKGFWLYGEVDTLEVADATMEALERLQRKEHWLATHPRCGTNLATSALLTGSVAYLAAISPARSRLAHFARVASAITLGLLVGRPLGMAVQRHITTTADVDNVRVHAVLRRMAGQVVVHRVLLVHK